LRPTHPTFKERPVKTSKLDNDERLGLLPGERSDQPIQPTRKEALRDTRARQREEYGGFNLGAAFFGWLVATGLAVLLIAILGAAGTAIGLTELLVVVLAVAYYSGGYVAGRLSRFDGARQGLGAWLFGLVVTILLAAAGLVLGSEYNVLQRLDLPRIPIDEGSLSTGGLIALGAIVLATLVAAVLGGKVGERYHRKVDRAGL
jgi:hypothetical protein